MKALESKVALKQMGKNFVKVQAKNLNKSARPTFYNLRLYFSNLRRNWIGYEKWDMVYGPEGFEKVSTYLYILPLIYEYYYYYLLDQNRQKPE